MTEFQSLLGKISGRVGNVVFFQRGNKTFIKRRPSPRGTPLSENEKAQRSKFGFVCKLAAKIASVFELKYFWKPERWNGRTSYNKIFKENYRFIGGSKLGELVSLVPLLGFELEDFSGKVNKGGLQIECLPTLYSEEYYGAKHKFAIAAGVVILKSPRKKDMPEYEIISFRSENIAADMKKEISFKISFAENDLELFKGYKDKQVHFAIITLDGDGEPLKFSTTMRF